MPAWLIPALMAGGKLLSGAAGGSAQQRGNENNQAAEKNRLLASLYNTRQNATMNSLQGQSNEQMGHANIDMDRRKFALAAPGVRASQSVRGSLMQNGQPIKLSGLPDRVASRIPTIEGGLSPALFNAETRALGGELTRKALIDQLNGDEFEPLQKTDFASGVLAAPKMEEFQKSGLLEKILGGLGTGMSIAGGIGDAVRGSRGDIPMLNNQMPSPYTGRDRYGNPLDFALKRGVLEEEGDIHSDLG